MIRLSMILACLLLACQIVRADDPPNVLIIMADDLGYSDVGCYGSEIDTPNLDRLAEQGIRFTRFYNTGRCWPTRAALMTGYYAQQVGRDALPGDPPLRVGRRPTWAPLLPELLAPVGYKSYHSGKWHIDSSPVASGFQHSYQLEDHDRFFYPQRVVVDDQPAAAVERGTDYYSTTEIATRAIQHLRQHARDNPEQPFLSYVAFLAPHFPLHAPEPDIAKYRGRYDAGWDQVRGRRYRRQIEMGIVNCELSAPEREVGPPYHFPKALEALGPGEVNRPLPWDELTAEQRQFQADKMAVHAAMVDRIDQEVGRIIDQLREMGVLDNTLILFLSDNGASAEIMVRGDGHDPDAAPGSAESYLCLGPGWSTCCNTPFRRHKTWVHEGGIATPLIAYWPDGIAAPGSLCHAPGHVIDVVPTVLELAGGESRLPGSSDVPRPGKSFVTLLGGQSAGSARTLWWLHNNNRALLAGDQKIVASGREADWELYDLTTDRGESDDLSDAEQDRVQRMQSDWTSIRDRFRDRLVDSERLPKKSN